MKYFYLILNPQKAGAVEMAEQIQEYLLNHGCTCQIQGELEQEKGFSYRYTNACQVPENTECVITLGGDGTLIQAARDLAGRRLPILGVNMGNVGYLTQIGRQEDVAGMLEDLIHDQYRLEKRMMLKGTVLRGGRAIKEDLALNHIINSPECFLT